MYPCSSSFVLILLLRLEAFAAKLSPPLPPKLARDRHRYGMTVLYRSSIFRSHFHATDDSFVFLKWKTARIAADFTTTLLLKFAGIRFDRSFSSLRRLDVVSISSDNERAATLRSATGLFAEFEVRRTIRSVSFPSLEKQARFTRSYTLFLFLLASPFDYLSFRERALDTSENAGEPVPEFFVYCPSRTLETGIPPRCRMRRPFRGVSRGSPYPFRIRKFVPLIRVTNTRRSYPLVRYASVARIDRARTDAFHQQRDYQLVVYDASEN